MLALILSANLVAAYSYGAPYKQDFEDNVNVLKFTGNAGPWSQRRGIGLSLDPPDNCVVDQVILYHRHGERYPDKGAVANFQKTWNKISKHKGKFSGELEFANYWEPYTSPNDGYIGLESVAGPYSGLNTGYQTGLNYAARYGHLWQSEEITPVFASGTERIVDTARSFINGFFGYNKTAAALNIIPEVDDQGANSLTPNCLNSTYASTNCQGNRKLPIFTDLAEKWNHQFKTNFTRDDILNLLQSTAYELNVRGDSPWVEAFPSEVWVAYEHYLSSGFWCDHGPNSPKALVTGSNFINASRTLLLQGPKHLPLSFNFAHDTDITPAQAFLGLDAAPYFNETYVQAQSGYHLSDIMPMGGRFTLERLVCGNLNATAEQETDLENRYELSFNTSLPLNGTTNATNATRSDSGDYYHYVRILVNEAVVPLDKCQSGPGLSCPLQEFSDYVDERLKEKGDFAEVCNIPANAPKDLQFWWKYNTTTELNNINSTVSYQALYVDYLDRPL